MSEMMLVQVPQPDRNVLMGTALKVLRQSEGMVIDAPEVYAMAADDLKSIKGRVKEIATLSKSLRDPFNAALDNLTRIFKEPMDAYTQAEGNIKAAMLTYSQEVERKRQADLIKVRAEADKKARKEREKMEAQAAKAAEKGNEEKAEALLQTAAAVVAEPVVVQAPAAPQVAGISTRTVLKWELTDKAALIQYVASHPEYLHLLEVDSKSMNNIVKALGDQCPVEGIRVYKEQVMASRSA